LILQDGDGVASLMGSKTNDSRLVSLWNIAIIISVSTGFADGGGEHGCLWWPVC